MAKVAKNYIEYGKMINVYLYIFKNNKNGCITD